VAYYWSELSTGINLAREAVIALVEIVFPGGWSQPARSEVPSPVLVRA
jgi:hypothetical protein